MRAFVGRFVCLAAMAALVLSPLAMSPVTAAGRTFRATDDLHVQYAGHLVVPATTRIIDLDSDATSAATVRNLHKGGRLVVCYISAGSLESYRSDAAKFSARVVGKVLDGWPDERWLDIRQLSVLLPLMRSRVATCKAKGFDAMDYDNVDAYSNDSGFPLTAAQQVRYNKALAGLAHAAGLRAVLKNAVDLVPQLMGSFDAALNEQCGQYSECAAYTAFVRAHKPVWVLEYSLSFAKSCAAVRRYGLHVQRKHLNLDAWRQACPVPRG